MVFMLCLSSSADHAPLLVGVSCEGGTVGADR